MRPAPSSFISSGDIIPINQSACMPVRVFTADQAERASILRLRPPPHLVGQPLVPVFGQCGQIHWFHTSIRCLFDHEHRLSGLPGMACVFGFIPVWKPQVAPAGEPPGLSPVSHGADPDPPLT